VGHSVRGRLEVAGTTSLKMSQGLTQLLPSLVLIPAYAISLALLTLAVREVPISVAYAVWSAVGTALIAAIGILWFREPATPAKGVVWFRQRGAPPLKHGGV
jgi:small multidrug resistance pump